jgi:alpha-L-fucosidase
MQKYFDQLWAVVKGQMSEVLTRYGKIDLLWWDGYDWPAGIDHHGQELEDYVRKLQPDIVLNDRNMLWDKGRTLGDYSTAFENRNPPSGRRAYGSSARRCAAPGATKAKALVNRRLM